MTLPPSPGQIVLIPNAPIDIFGPGIQWQLHAGVPSPLPSTATWDVEVLAGDNQYRVFGVRFISTSNPTLITPFVAPVTSNGQNNLTAAPDQTGAHVYVTLQEEGGGAAQASGDIPVTWDTTAGMVNVLQHQVATGGGLTTEQAQQVQETWQSTAQVIAVDSTLPASAGIAPPGGVISAQLPVPCFGLIVRITQLPPEITLNTPDGNYAVPSLAVATFFRGSDLWMRVPVHTSSKLIPLFGDVITAAVATAIAATWLLNMSYQVHFREGVAGEVIEMRFP